VVFTKFLQAEKASRMKGAMMKQRRALVTGLSMAMMGLAQAAPPKLPAADNGAEKGACPRCGRVHDGSEPLKQSGKP
jgi:hypothetical protein